jgi:hypothetical protein
VAVDPRQILREIAVDPAQPGAARVQACRILMAATPPPASEADNLDEITKKAILAMQTQSRRLN